MEFIIRKKKFNNTFDRASLRLVNGIPEEEMHTTIDKVEIAGEHFVNDQKIKRFIKVYLIVVLIVIAGIFLMECMNNSNKSEGGSIITKYTTGLFSCEHKKSEGTDPELSNKSTETVPNASDGPKVESSNDTIPQTNQSSPSVPSSGKNEGVTSKNSHKRSRNHQIKKWKRIPVQTQLILLLVIILGLPLSLLIGLEMKKRSMYLRISSLLVIENRLYREKYGCEWIINRKLSKLILKKIGFQTGPIQVHFLITNPEANDQSNHQQNEVSIEPTPPFETAHTLTRLEVPTSQSRPRRPTYGRMSSDDSSISYN